MIIYEKGDAIIMRIAKKRTPELIVGIAWSLTLFLFAFLIRSPKLASGAVRESLSACVTGLIPSLFPFLVLTGLFCSTGLCGKLSVILSPLAGIMGLPAAGASAVFLGALGGFPTGAVISRRLFESGVITKDEAGRLTAASNNAGLAFCVGTVGSVLYSDASVGWKLWGIQLFSAFLVAFVSNASLRRKKAGKPFAKPEPEISAPTDILSARGLMSAFSDSVTGAAMTMLKICAFAVFFGVVGRVVTLIVPGVFGVAALSFLELTLASIKSAALGRAGLPFCAFALGFAGMSVHAQVAAVLSGSGIGMRRYFVSKLAQGLISALMTAILC